MSVIREKVGELSGKEVYEYYLDNGKGLSARILNYGGIIKSLVYNGIDVVLGRDTFKEYLYNSGHFGAIIGRNSNRIENSEFELNGKVYKLNKNSGKHNLHGGNNGFDKKVWDVEERDEDEPMLILSYVSPDGEEGFPGEVKITVTYTLTVDNSLKIHYQGETDTDTILNMTNHSYFNMNGHSSGVIDGHTLWMNCDFYTPNNDECMPYGEVLSVKDTPFDFRKKSVIGERLNSQHPQIKKAGGFDHNFVLNGRGYRKISSLRGDKTGICMEVYTDQVGVQIFTKNFSGERLCKSNTIYTPHSGICFETQAFPNSLNYSHFPDVVLKKNEKYDTVTEYKFI